MVIAWDPIGLTSIGAPRDEYDCLSDPIMRQLESSATPAELERYLSHHIAGHFGTPADEACLESFAGKVCVWYAENWPDSEV